MITRPLDRNEGDKAPGLPGVRRVANNAALDWLKLAWSDLVATRFAGVLYGAIFVAMGFAIATVYATRWQLTMGLMGGFMLVGPFLATGIYELSRRRERGESVGLLASLTCWRRNPSAIGFFAVILVFCMIVWARVSLIVFALSSNTSFPTLQGIVGSIFSLENLPFIGLWTAVGCVFATLVFAVSVVSIPMLLDRGGDAVSAVFTSVRVLAANPVAMLVWAALITLIIGLSLLTGFFALLITAPLIGHATWHAYRATVDSEGTLPGS
jgi:uncharacterized membrane protein